MTTVRVGVALKATTNIRRLCLAAHTGPALVGTIGSGLGVNTCERHNVCPGTYLHHIHSCVERLASGSVDIGLGFRTDRFALPNTMAPPAMSFARVSPLYGLIFGHILDQLQRHSFVAWSLPTRNCRRWSAYLVQGGWQCCPGGYVSFMQPASRQRGMGSLDTLTIRGIP